MEFMTTASFPGKVGCKLGTFTLCGLTFYQKVNHCTMQIQGFDCPWYVSHYTMPKK